MKALVRYVLGALILPALPVMLLIEWALYHGTLRDVASQCWAEYVETFWSAQ